MWPFKKKKVVIVTSFNSIDDIYVSDKSIKVEIVDFEKLKQLEYHKLKEKFSSIIENLIKL